MEVIFEETGVTVRVMLPYVFPRYSMPNNKFPEELVMLLLFRSCSFANLPECITEIKFIRIAFFAIGTNKLGSGQKSSPFSGVNANTFLPEPELVCPPDVTQGPPSIQSFTCPFASYNVLGAEP